MKLVTTLHLLVTFLSLWDQIIQSFGDLGFSRNKEVLPPCHSFRRQLSKTSGRGGPHYSPSCDTFGFFSAVQCSDAECWCVNKCGTELRGSRVKGKKIKCGPAQFPCLQGQEKESSKSDMRSCDEHGLYKAKQCDKTTCWCVDRCGNELWGSRVASWETLNCDCPDNDRVYFCQSQCHNATCMANPLAICRGTYCGRCSNVFYDSQRHVIDCHNGKPGKCPAVPMNLIGRCDSECQSDKDCEHDLKCCSNGCGRVCISPRKTVKAGQCPPVASNHKCSSWRDKCQIDDDCVGLAKCCSDGCHKICRLPYEEQVRPGQCPFVKKGKHDSCSDTCVHDNDCPAKMKCCGLGCARHCVIPHSIEKLGTCPALITNMQCDEFDQKIDECIMDADCKDVKKCCNTSCGMKCVSPFLHGKPGICPASLLPPTSSLNCSHQCKDSKDCGGADVCCVNGCDRVCWAPESKDCIGKNGKKHYEGDLWHEDACTLCQCLGGQAACVLRQCNDFIPLGCTADPVQGACCPSISCGGVGFPDSAKNRSCFDQTTSSLHGDGELWHLDFCTECKCTAGHISCHTVTCPQEVKKGCQLIKRSDRCCSEIHCNPTCIDHMGKTRNDGDSWLEDPCTRCFCENGQRKCKVKNCPPVGKKCHAYKVPGKCCPEVKCLPNEGLSCVDKLSMRSSGDIWIRDICSFCTCFNGAVKCFKEKCKKYNETECYVSPLKRQCCGELICPMKEEGICIYNGVKYYNNEIWHSDLCTTCACSHGKVSCNVMACEQPRPGCIAEFVSGKCCPNIKCYHHVTGNLTCEDGGKRYPHGDTWYREPCKQCHCFSGRVTCTIRNCPKIVPHAGCHVSKVPGMCCPNVACRKERASCVDDEGISYLHGTTFQKDLCTTCMCEHGKLQCVPMVCPSVHQGCTEKKVEGQCCSSVICPDKSGWCPRLPHRSDYYLSSCSNECLVDADCSGHRRCCLEGCARRCRDPVKLDCIDSRGIHRQVGDQWYSDSCTLCQCRSDNTTVCKAITMHCPTPRKSCDVIPIKNQCCAEIECSLKDKGSCVYQNETYANGDHWYEDECSSCFCTNGQVYCTQTSCPPVPAGCRKIKQKNSCCPEVICHESHSCNVNGHLYLDREAWHLDECTQCRCDHGQSWCSRKVCDTPLLAGCYAVKLSGQCCPNVICNQPRLQGRQAICRTDNGQIYNHGELWYTDPCTKCKCEGGHTICNITSCPAIRGADCRTIPVPGQCCPNVHCRDAKSCIYKGVMHLNGERWAVSECKQCECVHGRIICEYTKCPDVPDGCEAVQVTGQCCPNIKCPGTVYDPRSCKDFYDRIRHHGDRWTTDYGCKFCDCRLGQITCRFRSCRPIAYRPGCQKIQYADMCCPDVICGKTKPGRCPAPDLRKKTVSCVDECHADSDCPKDRKCCVSACARQCIKPIFRLSNVVSKVVQMSKVKSGQCPVPKFGRRCLKTSHGCQTDEDCPYLRKCCFTGCNYDCVEPEIQETCPAEKPRVLCFHNPCKMTTCETDPEAICRVSRCEECRAIFYDRTGKELNCGKSTPSANAHAICPALKDIPKEYHSCKRTCMQNADCGNGTICCWNGCGRICVPAPGDGLKSCRDENGNSRPHGSVWKSSPCKTCSCVNGEKRCWRQTCTSVPPGCFAEPQVRECCPRVVCPFELRCSDDSDSPYKNQTWSAGVCTTCRCNGATPSCFAAVCRAPGYDWRASRRPNQCCPDLQRQGCRDNKGHLHPEGDFWMPDPCLRCRCEQGVTRCHSQQCYSPGVGCYSVHRDGHCCPDIICPKEGSRCHKVREAKYGKNNPHAGLWPSCDDNGDFSPLQCSPPTGHCWCVNKWGIEHRNTRVQYLMPTCGYRPCFEDVHKRVMELERTNIRDVYIPQCSSDGKYNTQQCDPVSKQCWCVEEDGTEIEGTRQLGKAACGCRDAFGVLRLHNEVFSYDSCRTCRCNQGVISCSVHPCSEMVPEGCKPVILPGHCCPRYHCGDQCLDALGRLHQIGDKWSVSKCEVCKCLANGIKCKKIKCPLVSKPNGCHYVPSLNGCCKEVSCSKCKNGASVADCRQHPCNNLKCPGFPNAVCRADFCGVCKAEFVDPSTEKPVNCNNEMTWLK